MPGIAQAAAARAGVARGRGRRRKALTAEEQAERDDYLREASFTAGTFTWSLFFFSAFLLGLASLITQHLVLGSLYGKRWNGMREGLWWQYLLTSLLYCFGLTMLSYCRIHSITIERNTGRVLVHKRPLWPLGIIMKKCMDSSAVSLHEFHVSDIITVGLRATGSARGDQDTRRFRLCLELSSGQELLINEYAERKHAGWVLNRVQKFLRSAQQEEQHSPEVAPETTAFVGTTISDVDIELPQLV